MEHPKCPKCKHDKSVKNGIKNGKQCYKCKNCGYQFTNLNRHSRREIKVAVALYSYGLSFRIIAKMFKASPNTICLWFHKYGKINKEELIEIGDKLRDFVRKRMYNCGFVGNAMEQILDFLMGKLPKRT